MCKCHVSYKPINWFIRYFWFFYAFVKFFKFGRHCEPRRALSSFPVYHSSANVRCVTAADISRNFSSNVTKQGYSTKAPWNLSLRICNPKHQRCLVKGKLLPVALPRGYDIPVRITVITSICFLCNYAISQHMVTFREYLEMFSPSLQDTVHEIHNSLWRQEKRQSPLHGLGLLGGRGGGVRKPWTLWAVTPSRLDGMFYKCFCRFWVSLQDLMCERDECPLLPSTPCPLLLLLNRSHTKFHSNLVLQLVELSIKSYVFNLILYSTAKEVFQNHHRLSNRQVQDERLKSQTCSLWFPFLSFLLPPDRLLRWCWMDSSIDNFSVHHTLSYSITTSVWTWVSSFRPRKLMAWLNLALFYPKSAAVLISSTEWFVPSSGLMTI